MLKALSHIGICVSDLERSRRFYTEALGFTFASELEVAGEPADSLLRLKDVKLKAIYLDRDGFRIELLHYDSPGRKPPARAHEMNDIGFTHLSFQVRDVQATLAALREAGATVLDDTVISLPGTDPLAAFVADPDGVLIELVQSPD